MNGSDNKSYWNCFAYTNGCGWSANAFSLCKILILEGETVEGPSNVIIQNVKTDFLKIIKT